MKIIKENWQTCNSKIRNLSSSINYLREEILNMKKNREILSKNYPIFKLPTNNFLLNPKRFSSIYNNIQ